MRPAVSCAGGKRESEAMLASIASDVGRVRETNEDAYCLCQLCTTDRPVFLAVADGMGGYVDGDIASELAVRQLRRDLEQYQGPGSGYLSRLKSSFAAANRAVFEAARGTMGTTLTCGLILGQHLLWAHVGDSRAYLVRRGELIQLTHDHSLVGIMVQNGELAEEEARQHPHRHLLMRALGTQPEVAVDTGEHCLETGDVLILCTDGLTNLVEGEELVHIVDGGKDLSLVATGLVELANVRGGTDNITVLVVSVDPVVGEERL